MTGNKKPLVSILSPSFNHEKYIKCFMESILNQSYSNWELIIVDDGSTDNNINEIKKFNDPRIKLVQQPFNMGINCAWMTAFRQAKGEYLVQCATDDMLTPNCVETVVEYMESHPNIGILYPALQCIDTENNIIPDRVIQSFTGTRYEILNKLFYHENCLTSPGQAMRKSVFAEIQPLDIAMSQYQDYKVHIDLVLNNDCHVLPDKLVLYRAPSSVSGISYRTTASQRRCTLEEAFVMDSFLKIQDYETLHNIFGKDLDQFGPHLQNMFHTLLPYALGTLALNSGNEQKKIWGYNQIARFINTMDNYKLANELYGFCYRDFLNLANKFEEDPVLIKYRKYKKLFNMSLIVIGALVCAAAILYFI